MQIDEDLNFIKGATCIYYAGLDHEALPFSEGEKQIKFSSNDQIQFIKALSLVADYIIIPPSFFFYWSSIHKNRKILRSLLDLFQANIVLAPIYTSMNMGTDFLEYKMRQGSFQDKDIISSHKQLLISFFHDIPVLHRNVHIQSGGFKELLKDEFSNIQSPPSVKKRIHPLIFNTKNKEVQVSRSQIHNELDNSIQYDGLNKYQYRKYYYAANRSYYKQGAITYDAIISLVGAERYSVLGKDIFSDKRGILIAYDPLVIVGILESIGITRQMINLLSINDLIDIRRSNIFPVFRDAYYSFALTLQELSLSVNKISKTTIFNIKTDIAKQFISRYFTEEIHYRKYVANWNFGEMAFFSLALGTAGFFVIPLVGAILGIIPIILYKLNLTPKLSNLVIEKIVDKETSFYIFVKELQKIVKNIREIEVNERSKIASSS